MLFDWFGMEKLCSVTLSSSAVTISMPPNSPVISSLSTVAVNDSSHSPWSVQASDTVTSGKMVSGQGSGGAQVLTRKVPPPAGSTSGQVGSIHCRRAPA